MSRKIFLHVQHFILMAVGSTVTGLAYCWFLIPHQVIPGGVSGIAMILNHFWGTPIGIATIVLNVPLFAAGMKMFGATYGVKSLIGLLLSSLMIDFFTYVVPVEALTQDVIMASIFGGLMLGAGIGLVFRGGGSTGGTDIVGQIVNRMTNLSTGTAILIADALIVISAGLAFGKVELALYAFLNIYLQTRAIDLVLEGVSYTRAMFIVSEAAEDITRTIVKKLNRGATLLHATGAYTGQERKVVFSVMSKREVAQVREIAKEHDPHAFIIITDVFEVLGEGFRPRAANPVIPLPLS